MTTFMVRLDHFEGSWWARKRAMPKASPKGTEAMVHMLTPQ